MATKGGGVYFPVDAGFCDTQAARQVVRHLGDSGFRAYVRLLCSLLNEDGGRLMLSLEDEWADLADVLGLSIDRTRELVALMERYGALVRPDGGGYVFSPMVSESIAARNEISEKRRAAGRASGEARRKRSSGEDERTHA